MPKRIFLFWAILFSIAHSQAQAPEIRTSADIYESIKKLNVLGSALYIAAHPDDENTTMISYLANERLVEATYLSLTRGDGGQNLIGPEIAELLGVIRTEELLAARRVDGGHQRFTRANDFGYSKNPEETLKIWSRDEILADVVWTIRSIQPDIIINRFDHDSGRRTHGHHTASAILSYEAFDLAGDPNAFPEQLKYVEPWQPKRLYLNTSWWFFGSREKFEQADKSNFVTVDAGVYYPAKGKSNTEISAESRSMHKCQGMGRTPSRGSYFEYLEPLKGSLPSDTTDLFSGIDISWSRLSGGEKVGSLVDKAIKTFQYDDPAASLPQLLEIYQEIQKLPDSHWKDHKVEEIHDVIEACMGLFLEATATDHSASPGQSVELALELVNRSQIPCELVRLAFFPENGDTLFQTPLEANEKLTFSRSITLPEDAGYTSPYWLNGEHPLGMYQVKDQAILGMPETPRLLKVRFDLEIQGIPISWTKDVAYKSTDRVKGEVYRPFEVLPSVFVKVKDPVYVFADNEAKSIQVVVKAGKADVSGIVRPRIPEGWKLEPSALPFDISLKDQEQILDFRLFPPQDQSEGWLEILAECEGETYKQSLTRIDYDHIPVQSILLQARTRIVKVALQKAGERIGYIHGAGDEVPASLEAIGYQVDILDPAEVTASQLEKYDAVVMGIRAYNTIERIRFIQPELFAYVEAGGTLIVQFVTTRGMAIPMEEMAPYPLNLSHDRVSVEEAPVTILQPDHAAINFPNAITDKDFEGWVQERGLYYPDEWDERFETILSSHDPGEPPTPAGLLIAPYGKGHYIYTGMAWFRQLPAGVPGAYRIFVNLLSIGESGS